MPWWTRGSRILRTLKGARHGVPPAQRPRRATRHNTRPDGQPTGAGIAAVTPGGLAAKAGLQPGDVITAVNGTATPDTQTLAAVLASLPPGQQASLSITKADGNTATVKLTLGQLPGS